MAAQGYDLGISGSASTSSSAATGATRFAPVTITNLGTGSNGALWILAAAAALWFFFIRKK